MLSSPAKVEYNLSDYFATSYLLLRLGSRQDWTDAQFWWDPRFADARVIASELSIRSGVGLPKVASSGDSGVDVDGAAQSLATQLGEHSLPIFSDGYSLALSRLRYLVYASTRSEVQAARTLEQLARWLPFADFYAPTFTIRVPQENRFIGQEWYE